MSNLRWLDGAVNNIVPTADLRLADARIFARLADSDSYTAAVLRECRRSNDDKTEAVIVDVHVDLGQQELVNDVHLQEAIAFVFSESDRAPFAITLREEFPLHVPHVNAAPQGEARSLCLFEAALEEIQRIYTPHRFLERVRWWLKETAYGRLHGNDQPLEPFFVPSPVSLVMPRGFRENDDLFLAGIRYGDESNCPIVFVPADVGTEEEEAQFHSIVMKTNAVEHGVLRWLPTNLGELVASYREVNIDIVANLAVRLKSWIGDVNQKKKLRKPAVLVVTTPLQTAEGEVRGRTERAYFLTDTSWYDVGLKFGILDEVEGDIALLVGREAQPRMDVLEEMSLVPANVHEQLTRMSAQESSGREVTDSVKSVLLVGAGALGSQIAVTAARGGFGKWTIVDSDFLLPHNTARHRLTGAAIGCPKAKAIALDINWLLGDDAAMGIVRDIVDFEATAEFAELAETVDLVIDASASIRVERMLGKSDKLNVPSVSMFLNPTGTALVVLAEGRGRSPRLDVLEMSYYWKLVDNEALAGHLATGPNTVAIGTCRSPSVRISQTFMSMFAAIAAEEIVDKELPAEGAIRIWSATGQIDEVSKLSWDGESFRECQLGIWSVVIREELLTGIVAARENAGKLETGGILAGAWDLSESKLYVVGHFDPPPDSTHESTGFVRGTIGVFHSIEHVELATAANLTYIGEWHTHPPSATSQVSGDDANLLQWIENAVSWNGVPAVMLIAADDGVRIIIQEERDRHEVLLNV